jgi:NHS family xanthosine MFS transporter
MVAGAVVDHYTAGGVRDWHSIWLAFASYALALGIVFPFVFRYRHDPAKMAAAATAH